METFVLRLLPKIGFVFAILALVGPAGAQPIDCPALTQKTKTDANGNAIPWNRQISFDETERVLSTGKITQIRRLSEAQKEAGKAVSGTHPVFLLTYKDGTRAIYKPDVGGFSTDGEADAYGLARLVGSEQVPPTVRRTLTAEGVDLSGVSSEIWKEIRNREGSVQYFVSSTIDLKGDPYFAKIALQRIPPKDQSDQAIFYFVFGQWDAHLGNRILDDSYRLALIDNAAIKTSIKCRYGGLPFRSVISLKASARVRPEIEPAVFPYQSATKLKNPTRADFERFLRGRCDPSEVERYWKYREKNKDTTMAVVIWHNRVWIQGIGFQNYGPMVPKVISESTLSNYQSLTFDLIRKNVSPSWTDEQIWDMIDRRDQLVKAARALPLIP